MRHLNGTRHGSLMLLALLLLTPLVAVARPQPVAAAGVVSQCTETALRAALEGGGLVTFSCSGTIQLASQLEISQDTIIDGGGQVTLDGGGTTRVLHVNGGVTLEVRGLTISGGFSTGFDGGSAILNRGTVTLTASTLSGNLATWGGAIDNRSSLTITASTLSGNSTEFGGGAIYNDPGATANITASTLANNHAGGSGGAIFNEGGSVTLTASTLSGNSAVSGGAIDNFNGAVTLIASILSGANLCSGLITSGGANVASDGSCNLNGPGDAPGVDPLLGTLQDNGGPTFTMLPQAGSPALDRVPNTLCATLSAANDGQDQRGFVRPVGASLCDSGAVEIGVAIQDIALSVAGSRVTLLVTAVDPLGGPLVYRFACANGVIGPQSDPTAVCDFGRQTGQFAVQVEATDANGIGVSETVAVELPTELCVGERSGTPRLMDAPGGCVRGEQPLVLTAAGSWNFCVGERSGSLRYLFNGNSNCLRGEWKLTLPEQGPITVCVGERSRSMRYAANANSCLRGELDYVIANRVG